MISRYTNCETTWEFILDLPPYKLSPEGSDSFHRRSAIIGFLLVPEVYVQAGMLNRTSRRLAGRSSTLY
ncbi:MAG: hypothetical protein JXK93_01580 [Sphaerochaetaceae bacterium]|nr:hypothetical protein [Sphaerochaetaceae bacterium]